MDGREDIINLEQKRKLLPALKVNNLVPRQQMPRGAEQTFKKGGIATMARYELRPGDTEITPQERRYILAALPHPKHTHGRVRQCDSSHAQAGDGTSKNHPIIRRCLPRMAQH